MPPSACETLRAWLLSALVVHGVVAGNPDAKRLYDDLLSNYNKLVRPVVNTSDVLRVCIKLKLSQLIDVNLKNQIMTTNLWVEQSWYDYKLRWEPKEYGGVHMLHVPSDHIWRPDIVLYNKNNETVDAEDARLKSASVSALYTRINGVKNQLQLLRHRLQRERSLLEEERINLYYGDVIKDKDINSSGTPPPDYSELPLSPLPSQAFSKLVTPTEQPPDKATLSPPSKRHLQEIEQQCDLELSKLHNYIRNIGELKTHWRCLMRENRGYETGPFQSEDNVTRGVMEFSDERLCTKSDSYFQ